jgi:preprotein translocase subunit SecA
VAIESRLVSRTIESAQSRVEGFNFDIRKRVVEYDDVINRQRETIYEERDKVLRNEDLTDTVQSFLDQEFDVLVDVHLPSELPPQDWKMPALVAAVQALGLLGSEKSAEDFEDELWDLGKRDAIAAHLKDLAAEKLEAKDRENPDEWALIERLVLLRTIDSIWVEHLTEVDEMRQGIGLRGFAQEDPLNAFKKEAFHLYEEMSALIRHQVATTIFRVSIVRQPAPMEGTETRGEAPADGSSGPDAAAAGRSAAQAAPGSAGGGPGKGIARAQGGNGNGSGRSPALPPPLPRGRESRGAADAASGVAAGAIRPGYSPSGQRMGRNDQCWCGSGRKYKKCHGA